MEEKRIVGKPVTRVRTGGLGHSRETRFAEIDVQLLDDLRRIIDIPAGKTKAFVDQASSGFRFGEVQCEASCQG